MCYLRVPTWTCVGIGVFSAQNFLPFCAKIIYKWPKNFIFLSIFLGCSKLLPFVVVLTIHAMNKTVHYVLR